MNPYVRSLIASTAFMSLAAWAAPDVSRQEACRNTSGSDERAACLKGVAADAAKARSGSLGNGENAQARANNALLRCQVHQGSDRTACERLVRGEGTVSGSVEGGGLIKELVTRTVEPAASAPR